MSTSTTRTRGPAGRPQLKTASETPAAETPLIRSIGVLAYDKVSEQDCLTQLEIFKGAALVMSGAVSPWEREASPETLDVQLGREVGTIVSMMFDTFSGIGEVIFELLGPEFYEHPSLEQSFQDLFEDMLLPAS